MKKTLVVTTLILIAAGALWLHRQNARHSERGLEKEKTHEEGRQASAGAETGQGSKEKTAEPRAEAGRDPQEVARQEHEKIDRALKGLGAGEKSREEAVETIAKAQAALVNLGKELEAKAAPSGNPGPRSGGEPTRKTRGQRSRSRSPKRPRR